MRKQKEGLVLFSKSEKPSHHSANSKFPKEGPAAKKSWCLVAIKEIVNGMKRRVKKGKRRGTKAPGISWS